MINPITIDNEEYEIVKRVAPSQMNHKESKYLTFNGFTYEIKPKMKASQICGKYGFTVKDLSDSLGIDINGKRSASVQTLHNWYRNKPLVFKAVLVGQSALMNGAR